MAQPKPPPIPLPTDWPDHARAGALHAIALAHHAITIVRGWCANSPIARVRLVSEVDQLREEVALLREEIRIKDARMKHIPAAQRPHFPPPERLAILELKAARKWSNGQAARRFLLTPTTIANWLRRLDEEGEDALVQIPVPVNRFPDLVGHVVQKLRALCPTMGRARIANVLARAGLHLGSSTVRRMLQNDPSPAPLPPLVTARKVESGRTVTAKRPNHVWNVDLTTIPIRTGFWVPWLPFSLPPVWPFCWWVLAIVDHFSRRSIGFALFRKQPSSEEVVGAIDRAVDRVGAAPKYFISDHGGQFNDDYRDWCAHRGIKPRFGAVGKYGSIALTERFILTLKDEGLRCIIVPFSFEGMRSAITSFLRWYDTERPHTALDGATPIEIYHGMKPANRKPRVEPRARYPASSPCAAPQVPIKGKAGAKLRLVVSHVDGQKHLPVVRLKRAA